MRNDSIELRYQLHFKSGFHCGTGLRRGLLHRGVARDSNGFLYVPGSTFKGILRDHATQLARFFGLPIPEQHTLTSNLSHFAVASQFDVVTHVFGSHFRPGTVFFDDASLCEEDQHFFCPPGTPDRPQRHFLAQQIETRTQVSMSRVTGTARRGMLFSSEYGKKDIRLDGRIVGLLPGVPVVGKPSVSYSLLLLLAALHSLDRIGGGRSAGLGQVEWTPTFLRVNTDEYSERTAVEGIIAQWLKLFSEFEYYELAVEEGEV